MGPAQRERTVIPLNSTERTGHPHVKKNETGLVHCTMCKTQLKMDSRCKHKVAKQPDFKKTTLGRLHGIGVGDGSVNVTPKAQATQPKQIGRVTLNQKPWKADKRRLEMATSKGEKKTVNHTSAWASSPKHTRNPYNSAAKPQITHWN